MRNGQQVNCYGGSYELFGDANTPFSPTTDLFVYKLFTTHHTRFTYPYDWPYTYDLDTHGIAYNFKKALWEDYGTKDDTEERLPGPYFVEQTGDKVRLKDINHFELGHIVLNLNNAGRHLLEQVETRQSAVIVALVVATAAHRRGVSRAGSPRHSTQNGVRAGLARQARAQGSDGALKNTSAFPDRRRVNSSDPRKSHLDVNKTAQRVVRVAVLVL
jgi:hypothetical protein